MERFISHDAATILSFKIPILVEDQTGSIKLTLFDREAVKVLGISAKQLLEKNLQEHKVNGEDEKQPVEFESSKNKKFAFRISIGQYNLDNKKDGFGVKKLVEDPTLIAELEKYFTNLEDDGSRSNNKAANDFSSESEIGYKATDSSTADNLTPTSVQIESQKNYSIDMKRNLEDLYDCEDSSCVSTTKVKKNEVNEDVKQKSKKNLLIPKVEK